MKLKNGLMKEALIDNGSSPSGILRIFNKEMEGEQVSPYAYVVGIYQKRLTTPS